MKKDKKITLLESACLLMCVQLLSRAQPFVTLMDCSLPGSSVRGFSRQEYWSGLPFSPPGDLLTQGLKPHLLH